MKEHGMIFNAEMVRAILDGRSYKPTFIEFKRVEGGAADRQTND